MKQAYSTNWKRSVKPSKQRKYRYNAPLHIMQKFLGVHLSKELRTKYGTRSIAVKKGDKVVVLRGQYRKKEGKIERVSLKNTKVHITGIEKIKRDGSKSLYPFNQSNLMIKELDTSDKKRFKEQKNDKKSS